MKKIILLALSFVLFNSNGALASGVPTADVLAVTTMITENMKNLQKQAEQITSLKDQLEQMKSQAKADIRRFEGNLGKLLNTDNLYSIVGENLDNLLSSTSSNGASISNKTRDKYGLKTDNQKLQATYDAELKKLELLENNFKASVKRTSDLIELKNKAIKASTPAEKQDVANELAYQQAQMQNEMIKLAQIREAQDQDNILKMKAKNKTHNEEVSRLMKQRW